MAIGIGVERSAHGCHQAAQLVLDVALGIALYRFRGAGTRHR
jgi:hypothetical protein